MTRIEIPPGIVIFALGLFGLAVFAFCAVVEAGNDSARRYQQFQDAQALETCTD